jgi:hypothetical protein
MLLKQKDSRDNDSMELTGIHNIAGGTIFCSAPADCSRIRYPTVSACLSRM